MVFIAQIDFYVTYSKPLYAGLLQPPSPSNGGFTERGKYFIFTTKMLNMYQLSSFADDSAQKEEKKTHRRIGSAEGLVELRNHTPNSHAYDK